jgi:hypothetical protein
MMLPGAAGPSRVTVPTAELGPTTGFGEMDTLATPRGRTVNMALLLMPP